MEATVRRVLGKFKLDRHYGALVETTSNIPVAVGLKSSSAASNAIALATLKALGIMRRDTEIVKLGVDASLEAGVSLTGAYDDACACYFGGLVVTNNTRRQILRRFKPKGRYRVLIHVPKQKKYTKDVDAKKLEYIQSIIETAHREALRGNFWLSLTLNGLTYAGAFGYDLTPIREALTAGAIASGLSGKGPAIAAVVPVSKVESVISAWSSIEGRVIETSFNYEKAKARKIVAK